MKKNAINSAYQSLGEAMGKTLFEKVWDSHVVYEKEGYPSLIYVDRHLVHEVTSPQAFDGLRVTSRRVRRPELTFATMDHNVPTSDRTRGIADPISAKQVEALRKNCGEFGVKLFDILSPFQGIVHIIGPELGLTLPGTTIVCGDSHTSTHGAFGAIAFGIGTSEVEHVLATQCLWQVKPKTFEIRVDGKLSKGVTAKDVILSVIRKTGTAGASGHAIEYGGELIEDLSMEERMTICNMSIEAGAKAGLISPDSKTFDYVRGKMYSPKGEAFEEAVTEWKELPTDGSAKFDKRMETDASRLVPQVTWGTNPAMSVDVTGCVPSPGDFSEENMQTAARSALDYMGLEPGTPIVDIKLDRIFIGSCTNSRLSDLQQISELVKGNKVAPNVRAMVVPGSQTVKREAERLGIDGVFKEAGFEWRESGCSMCLGMNPDILRPKERCASTSNRNFEGRQGAYGRTHLVSPIMAVAAAIAGHFVDTRQLDMPAVIS